LRGSSGRAANPPSSTPREHGTGAPRARTSSFGTRRDPFTGRPARHEGLDFAAPAGTPILASAGGRVVTAGASGAYGNAVVIDHGNGLATLRARLPAFRRQDW
jgi:murein DD-endopeptidase MepM/ murein hydrolase activator NlpD